MILWCWTGAAVEDWAAPWPIATVDKEPPFKGMPPVLISTFVLLPGWIVAGVPPEIPLAATEDWRLESETVFCEPELVVVVSAVPGVMRVL